MTATSGMVARLRRMVNEPTEAVYTDGMLAEEIERYPLVDAFGYDPDNENWTETYDLNAAAASIWDEKTATLTAEFDFSADGGNYSRSQKMEMAQKMARMYRSRRSIKTITQTPSGDDGDESESV